jgi:hypothetical protein
MEVSTARANGKQILLNVRPHTDCEGLGKKQHKQVKKLSSQFILCSPANFFSGPIQNSLAYRAYFQRLTLDPIGTSL